MKLILLLCVAAAASVVAAEFTSYKGYKVFRVQVDNADELKALSSLEEKYDFWTDPKIGFVDVMSSPTDNLEIFLQYLNLKYEVFIQDVEALVEAERKINKQSTRMEWTAYQRLATIHNFIDEIAAANPNNTQVFSIGNSTEGRDLKGIKIGTPGTNKPAIWLDAGIHAREWISPACVTWFINELLTNAAQYQDILDDVDFYIVPSSNPDGCEFTHTTTRMWRKTRSVNTGSSCRGVDPNRNFEYHWGGPGTSADPCSDIYKGLSPWSEPETRAIRDFILGHPNINWQVSISVHSYAQMWLIPWGYTYDLPDDYDKLKALGVLASDALKAVHGTNYTVGSITEILTPGSGGSVDWGKGLGGFKYAYAPELRDTGAYGQLLPPNQIIPTGQETWAAFQVVARFLIDQNKKNLL